MLAFRTLKRAVNFRRSLYASALSQAAIRGKLVTMNDDSIESERPAKIRKLSHSTGPDPQAKPRRNSSSDYDSQEIIVSDGSSPVGNDQPTQPPPTTATQAIPSDGKTVNPLSKNQLKKQKRRDEWEAGRDYRKAKRKQKTKEKRERKKAANAERLANPTGGDSSDLTVQQQPRKPRNATQLPVTLIIDCGFDSLMMEKEYISLGSQLTRAYSDNSRSGLQVHLAVSSWGGKLKDRFETVLSGHYRSWRGMRFFEEPEGFVEVAERARGWMAEEGNRLSGAFKKFAKGEAGEGGEAAAEVQDDVNGNGGREAEPLPDPETIYLTADSPYTLTELRPNSSYIIGGIVDKNRHKGICYKIAREKGIKTAKLPIGEFMEMQSRSVLATNHVVEIMIRWLECGDWGEAFGRVIPKRKGGVLKKGEKGEEDESKAEEGQVNVEDEAEDEQQNGNHGSDQDDEHSEGADEELSNKS